MRTPWFPVAVITLVAAALRCWLGLVVYPGAGYRADLELFVQWAAAARDHGLTSVYAVDSSANYPPVGVAAMGAMAWLAGDHATWLPTLVKLPAVVADVLCVPLAAGLAHAIAPQKRRTSAAVMAAGLLALTPVLWYDSALWGQLDALVTVFTLAALVCWTKGWSELAAIAGVLATMAKPQGVLVLVVLAVAVLATHLVRQRWRLLTTLLAGAATGLGLLTLFRYRVLAPGLEHTPVWGDLVGFWRQSLTTVDLYPNLSANAYNLWALVGEPPLVSVFNGGIDTWLPDSWGLFTGTPFATSAHVAGLVLLGVATLVVVAGLVRRHDGADVVLATVVLGFCFFALPTRSHERYLVTNIAVAAAWAAASWWRVGLHAIAGAMNLVNLHAVLGSSARQWERSRQRTDVPGGPGGGGPGPGGGGPGGFPGDGSTPTQILLPWGDQARLEIVGRVVSVGQTALAVALLAAWIVHVARPRPR
ncbi:hypothetical protein ACSDQ9_13615 [Aestuariimicrobium soli]|uniref:hypothetical protein n=1 Tax=Aestuariimicrobium soli TaxID=2035834 RepID=UPI003EB8406F